MNVGAAGCWIVVVTVGAGVERHCPVCAFVWQTVAVNGMVLSERTTWAVSAAVAPILSEATARRPVLLGPPVCENPSFDGVTPTAMASGTGVLDADSSSVLMPLVDGAALASAQ